MPKCFAEEWGGASCAERLLALEVIEADPEYANQRDGGKRLPTTRFCPPPLQRARLLHLHGRSIKKDLARVGAAREAAAAASLPYPVPAKGSPDVVARGLPSPSLRQRKPESRWARRAGSPRDAGTSCSTRTGATCVEARGALDPRGDRSPPRTRRLAPVAQISEAIGPATLAMAEVSGADCRFGQRATTVSDRSALTRTPSSSSTR